MKYRETCLETANKEMELSENLLNQLMPPHIHKAVRVGRPYGESCEVKMGHELNQVHVEFMYSIVFIIYPISTQMVQLSYNSDKHFDITI